jgi:hypothetical protein
MRWVYILALLAFGPVPVLAAQTETCKSQADDKKLAGASLRSFMSNCKRDARSTCDESADEKNLSGTAHAICEKMRSRRCWAVRFTACDCPNDDHRQL